PRSKNRLFLAAAYVKPHRLRMAGQSKEFRVVLSFGTASMSIFMTRTCNVERWLLTLTPLDDPKICLSHCASSGT
ncbi:MAG: hypothetical protein WBM68_04805, partial [Woeseia sp.]